jgi:hypothetical protein
MTDLEEELRQAKRCVRWSVVALVFIILSLIFELPAGIFMLLDTAHVVEFNRWPLLWFMAFGCLGLSFYAKWLSDSERPESWGPPRRGLFK